MKKLLSALLTVVMMIGMFSVVVITSYADTTVYVTASGKKYHESDECSNMKSPIAKGLSEAKNEGYTACSKCAGGSNSASHTHSYKKTTTKATLTKNGKIVKKCSCGAVKSESTIRYAKTIKLEDTSYTYNGKAKKPDVIVKDSKGKTISSKYYTVSYASGRKNVGKYKVTVTFKGNYSGKKTLTFKINPVKTAVSELTAAKKAITVAITKKKTQVTGYQIQYSTSSKFKSAKTKNITSYNTTKTKLTDLSAKKTYYMRVRTYMVVNGTKYYSAWSATKSEKTK